MTDTVLRNSVAIPKRHKASTELILGEVNPDKLSKLTLAELDKMIAAGHKALLLNRDNEAAVILLQIKLQQAQRELDKRIRAYRNPYKQVDSFESAVKMAIENDGKIDAKEKALLDKMILNKDEETQIHNFKMRVIIFPSFVPFLGPTMNITFVETDEYDIGFDTTVNQGLRNAYKIAAADGKISEKEVSLLKESLSA